MNLKKIKVPFLDDKTINEKTSSFRKKFNCDFIPVDIEKVIELKLRFDIIPVPDLQKLCYTDALISSDWEKIYVDKERYLDDRYQKRVRFSFAHELGHFILHKELYSSFDIKKFEDFYDFYNKIPCEQYGYLETQANKFANFLLIPRKYLVIEKEKIIKRKELADYLKSIGEKNKRMLNSYIAIPLSDIFEVSEEAMEIALNSTESL